MTAAVAGTDYLAPNGSAASLTNFPTFNQNTTGNAATATLATTATIATNATTAGNITATSNTTLTSLANLTTVGTITSGTWSGTAIAVANGGTGATNAAGARTKLGLVIGTNVQAPLVAGTDYLAPNGSAASLTNFPTLNQNTTGNAATATLATTATTATNATTAGNITATSNTTLTSLSNLTTVGTITTGTWSGTAIAVANGGTGATTAADARTNLGLVIGTNVQAPLVAGTDYLAPNGSAANLTNFPTLNQNTTGNAATATLAGNITATSNTTLTSLTGLNTVGTITSGTISLTTDIKTTSTITAGSVTYPNTHGTSNQVLTTTGSGTLTFTTPTVAKPISDQFTATAAQTSFTLTQTPITNTTVSPNIKPNVWMFINGVRTNNNAYSVSGTTVTYTAASNNSYTIVVGDRIQFDYAY